MPRRVLAVFSLGFLGILFSSVSWADGIQLEPYLGYGLGSLKAETDSDSTKLGSLDLGARAGYAFLDHYFADLDFNYSPLTSFGFPTSSAAQGASLSGSHLRFGLIAGGYLPRLILKTRAWIGYNFIERTSISDQNYTLPGGTASFPGISQSGSSFKLGVGVEPVSYLSVNLEFIMASYGSFTTPSVSTDYPSGQNPTAKTFFLSVSAPFTFPIAESKKNSTTRSFSN
jgi:hypothetical protein